MEDDAKVSAYLGELVQVGLKHGFVLGHEDSQGGFLVYPATGLSHETASRLRDWLRDASVANGMRRP